MSSSSQQRNGPQGKQAIGLIRSQADDGDEQKRQGIEEAFEQLRAFPQRDIVAAAGGAAMPP